jgi:catechol 2,3-dioxygenase
MGHVHLQVSDLEPAERFYAGALELEVTVRSYPGALFLSAGGYHHHVGANVWQTRGGPPPPEGALGLEHWELALPSVEERDRLGEQLASADAGLQETDAGMRAADASGNRVLLSAPA